MDDIQRKLILLDKKRGGWKLLAHRVISTSPLVLPVLGLVTGIIIQKYIPLPILIWLGLVIISILPAAFICITRQFRSSATPSQNDIRLLSCIAFICFTSFGALRLISYYQPRSDDIRNFITERPVLATIRAEVSSDPKIIEFKDWKFAKFKPADPATSMLLNVEQIQTATGWSPVSGTISAIVDEPILDLDRGDHIQFYCWLDTFSPPTNPGQFDSLKYYNSKNIFLSASIKTAGGIKLLKKNEKNFLKNLRAKLQKTASTALLFDVDDESSTKGLLEALLLGYRKDIDHQTYAAFRKTGLLHFISLSGMHFGIIISIIWLICRTAGLSKQVRALICIIACLIFLMIIPPRPPAVRAAIITIIFCLSILLRRNPNSLNSLALAAIILLLIRPATLFDAGFQLSFASVLGILLFSEKILFFIKGKLSPLTKTDQKDKNLLLKIISPVASWVLTLFSVGLAAWLGGAGILLYHFYTINPITCIWTILVFPFIAFILIAGFFKILLALLVPATAALLGSAISFVSNILIIFVKFIAQNAPAEILIGQIPLSIILFYYFLILLAASPLLYNFRFKKAGLLISSLMLVSFLVVTKYNRTHYRDLAVTTLDVTHGQAIFIQAPPNKTILIDAGSLYNNDVGTRIVSNFLNFQGITKIDNLFISHNDIDHINGIPEVARGIKIGAMFANELLFSDDSSGSARMLKRTLDEMLVNAQPPDNILALKDTVPVEVIWPTEAFRNNPNLSDNDRSLVCLLEYSGKKVLICSDIEQFAQQQILKAYPDLTVDIIILPHHGSTRTLDPDFLGRLKPAYTISSCAENRLKSQPLSYLKNTRSFYTARDGAINIRIDRRGNIKAETFVEVDEQTAEDFSAAR